MIRHFNKISIQQNEVVKFQEEQIRQTRAEIQKYENETPIPIPSLNTEGLDSLIEQLDNLGSIQDTVVPYRNETKPIRKIGKPGNEKGELYWPTRLALDGDKIYIADVNNNRIQIFSTEGNFIHEFGKGQLYSPYGIALHNEWVFILDRVLNANAIFKFSITNYKLIRSVKEELGQSTSNFLHKMGVYYPDEPSQPQQEDMLSFLHTFSYVFPCEECAEYFRDWMSTHPPVTTSSLTLSLWLCRAHNVVNARLAAILTDRKEVEKWLKTFPNLIVTDIKENPHAHPGGALFNLFKEKYESLAKNNRKTALAFHGIPEVNINSICQNGYDASLRCKQAHGPGEYFSTTPDCSLSYCRGREKMMVNELLLGTPGQHHTQSGSIIVMKDPAHDLPRFVITFQ
ncbi:hypothetical protein LOD99_10635 [Oopsacas minuta]|uniref:Sulfhydryl oxidase n=1 Tax=Oopsacas minuta TaxID=111878 RepID=A0AAV7KFZ4_9METZ|nr:hypothetical protein LOD99_10635 [Oopsacas minuta]